MKAIINVNNGSAYVLKNGLTYDVKKVLSYGVLIDLPSEDFGIVETLFLHKEILIVDIWKEVQTAVKNMGTQEGLLLFLNLTSYIDKNNIKHEKVHQKIKEKV